MPGSLKSDQRLIETVRLPVRLCLTPIAGMSGQAEKNLVTAEILCALVSISPASSRSADERQTDGPVVGFVGRVLAVG